MYFEDGIAAVIDSDDPLYGRLIAPNILRQDLNLRKSVFQGIDEDKTMLLSKFFSYLKK